MEMNETAAGADRSRAGNRLFRVLKSELSGLRPRLLLASALVGLLPDHSLSRVRTLFYRLGGLQIGRATLLFGRIALWGTGDIAARLRIGEACLINAPLRLELEADITIGHHVSIGHGVTFITASHELGTAEHRSGPVRPAPIVIEDGCLIGACSVILPGVTLGRGAVVAAGSVVAANVEAGKLVGGNPARQIRSLS